MEQFKDVEVAAIWVALALAKSFIKEHRRVQAPPIFKDIEQKIQVLIDADADKFLDLTIEAVGDLEWIN